MSDLTTTCVLYYYRLIRVTGYSKLSVKNSFFYHFETILTLAPIFGLVFSDLKLNFDLEQNLSGNISFTLRTTAENKQILKLKLIQ